MIGVAATRGTGKAVEGAENVEKEGGGEQKGRGGMENREGGGLDTMSLSLVISCSRSLTLSKSECPQWEKQHTEGPKRHLLEFQNRHGISAITKGMRELYYYLKRLIRNKGSTKEKGKLVEELQN